jgi:type II secretory pathway component PulC
VEVDDDLQFVLHGTGISAKRFVSDVSLTRVKDSGVPVGYRLTPKRQSGALQAAGFQNGDIILEVNEFPVSEIDLEDMQDLLLAATVFEFYIERGERTERVIVEFAQGVDN